MTPLVWHHLRVTLDATGRVEARIDDVPAGTARAAMNHTRTHPWQINMGNFDGDMDEVRISNTVRSSATGPPDSTAPTAPTELTALPLSTSTMHLRWRAASDPESGIASYQVYRDSVLIRTVADTSVP